MDKDLNAYMSVEGSVLFSMTIFIYYLVILSSGLLMTRCLTSQNNYIIGMRTASFSYGSEEYGEIIYGQDKEFDAQGYGLKRLNTVDKMYIFVKTSEKSCIVSPSEVVISTGGKLKIGSNNNETVCTRINPVRRIRELRY